MDEPLARLDAAVADLRRFRDEWEEIGSPSLAEGSTGQLVPHPYIKLIREAERAVDLLSKSAAVRRGGRPPGAQSAPDREPSSPPRRAKLKAV